MLHWIALLPGVLHPLSSLPEHQPDRAGEQHQGDVPALGAVHLGWWALQFTPRVALLDGAVVLEVQASERLFGGAAALRERIAHQARGLGVRAWAHAGTALAAVALARHGGGGHGCANNTEQATLSHLLDPLPLPTLPGVAAHQATLARLGCQCLAQVRQLPRAGLSRRFGAGLLQTLDQAYGLRPEAFDWLTLPPVFDAQLELPGRVESAPTLLLAATRLLQQLCAWLAGHHAGVNAFTLRWLHDWHRRDSSPSGAWTVRLASPSRDTLRLSRLLAEHLQRIQLGAPVGHISLHADTLVALPPCSLNLFGEHGACEPDTEPDALLTPAAQRAQREALWGLLEKLSVRLGPERILQGQMRADHRLEFAQKWQAAMQAGPMPAPASAALHMPDTPQPCWVLPEPMPLALASDGPGLRERPLYQGQLKLLAGPHRVEAGWWDTPPGHGSVARDYYLASSEHAGLLWVFKARHASSGQRSPWYLHGFFA